MRRGREAPSAPLRIGTYIIGPVNLLYRVLRLEAGLDMYHESQLSI